MHTGNLVVNGNRCAAPVTQRGGEAVRRHLVALLAKERAHGYELKQALQQTFGSAYPSPNIGQIYVTLGRLEKDGLVRSVGVEQSNRPNKKVYYLTAKGRDVLHLRSEEHTSELQSRENLVCRLLLEKKNRSLQ